MKKIALLFISLLSLCVCNTKGGKNTKLFISLLSLCACNTKGDKNTNVVEQSKYKKVNYYYNVSYSFDSEMRCVVHYDHYLGGKSKKNLKKES